jgi:DNA-directed RNA polymerase specialized sigma24 family protein
MAYHRAGSSITEHRLARLLARLDPDRERAAREYERLHRILVRFFDWRGIPAPEDCADEAIDRLAARLEADPSIADVRAFALGVARMLALELRRRPVLTPIDRTTDVAVDAPVPSAADARLHDCFERCLDELPGDARSLLLSYYEGQLRGKIANRRRLADSLGLSESALRNRIQRLRNRVEACVQRLLGVEVKE